MNREASPFLSSSLSLLEESLSRSLGAVVLILSGNQEEKVPLWWHEGGGVSREAPCGHNRTEGAHSPCLVQIGS